MFTRAHLWQTLRLLLACGLAEGAGHLVGLHETYWALISAVAVTRPAQTDTREKAFARTLGSLIGAIVGFGVLLLAQTGLPKPPLFAAALVPLALLTAIWPGMRLAPITLIVVVLVPSGADPLVRPRDRVIEIFLGSLAGWLVAIALDADRLRRILPERLRPEAEG